MTKQSELGVNMRIPKSLAFGAVAILVAVNAAQAADLPVKAKAVEYVKVCSLYGAGFSYIPGTDTCIRLGGYIRVDATFNGGIQGQPAYNGDLGQGNRYADDDAARSRLALTIDTRTNSEYGVVRTFAEGRFQFSTLGNSTANPNSLATNLGNNASLTDTAGGGSTNVSFLFVQFAGFTIGKSASAYATPWYGYPGNISDWLFGGEDDDTGNNNIQYTAELGNGLSVSAGLDDPTVWDRTAIYNLSLPLSATLNSGNAYAATQAPDIVARLRLDQAWGLVQISGSAHEVDASYNVLGAGAVPTALSEISGHPDTKWGGSGMLGLQIRNIPTGPGDDIKFDASYAYGDTKKVIAGTATSPSFAMFGGSNSAYQSIGFGATTDAVYLPGAAGGSLDLTESYGLRGAFNHNWNAYWSTSLYGGYSAVRYDSDARSAICTNYTATLKNVSADYSCNPDFSVSQVGVSTRWTPVKNLTFTGEVQWFHLDQNFRGTATLTPAAPMPTAVYQFKNQDTAFLQVRVQRNF
jgi:hypothetical protein